MALTETGMNTSNPYVGERIAGSVGLPLPGGRTRIADGDATACRRESYDRGARSQRLFKAIGNTGPKRPPPISRRRLLHQPATCTSTPRLMRIVTRQGLIITAGSMFTPRKLKVCGRTAGRREARWSACRHAFRRRSRLFFDLQDGAQLTEALSCRRAGQTGALQDPQARAVLDALPPMPMASAKKPRARNTAA